MRIAMFFLVLLSGGMVAKSAAGENPATPVAHFAVIYPDADLTEADADKLTPDATWLRRPRKKPANGGTQPTAKKSTSEKKKTSPATVTPLRRDRPKNEVDPPKTRRRPLGW